MCFNNSFFCGCRRNRCHRFEESSDFHNRRHNIRNEESSDMNSNVNRNTFSVRSAFNQDDFCRAVRRCNQRNRNVNRRNNNW